MRDGKWIGKLWEKLLRFKKKAVVPKLQDSSLVTKKLP
jgi:hypothetical protein